jgi:hypothetical protein
MRIALEELLKAIPDFSIDSDEPLEYNNVAVRAALQLPVKFTPRAD